MEKGFSSEDHFSAWPEPKLRMMREGQLWQVWQSRQAWPSQPEWFRCFNSSLRTIWSMQILLPGQISFNLEDVKANLKRSINKKVQNVIEKSSADIFFWPIEGQFFSLSLIWSMRSKVQEMRQLWETEKKGFDKRHLELTTCDWQWREELISGRHSNKTAQMSRSFKHLQDVLRSN